MFGDAIDVAAGILPHLANQPDRYFRVTSSQAHRQVLVGVWSIPGKDAGGMARREWCSQKKTRPVVSDAKKTMAITFAIRRLRRAPPIGGRRDGAEAVSEKGGKSLPRRKQLHKESPWNGQLSEESRGSTLVPLRLAERRSFSTGEIEPPGLSTPHQAPAKMIG